MKNFMGKLRISAAMDSSEPMPAGLRRMISSSTALRAFERSARELDQHLRLPVEKHVPADLHASIMRRVRASGREAPARPGIWFSRWVPVPAGLALAAVLVWAVGSGGVVGKREPAPVLSSAAAALNLGGEVGNAMPTVMMGPMTEELDRLNRDLDETARFLLASLP